MGHKIYLENYSALLSFIDYATDIHVWPVHKFTLSTLEGVTMNIDTHAAGGTRQRFVELKDYINTYYVNNGEKSIIVDVKLACPEEQRTSIDPNGYYQQFFLNLYSSISITYLNLAYAENGRELVEAPYLSWCAYINTIYRKWRLYVES